MKDPARDKAIERMLERVGNAGAAGGVCPDAETLAAWTEGSLRPAQMESVESHVADCARCQTHLAAMARMGAPERVAEPRPWAFGPRWLVPLAGSVAAAGLWFLVQSPPTPPVNPIAEEVRVESRQAESQPPATREAQTKEAPAIAQQRSDRTAATAPPAASRDRGRVREGFADSAATRNEVADQHATEQGRSVVGGIAAPAAPVPPQAAPVAEPGIAPRDEHLQMRSEAAAAGGRLAIALDVRRAADGTITWDPKASELAAQIMAGSSPSPAVVWLVGRQGLVLRSTDGRTFHRTPFPEPIDLAGIVASGQLAATVTSADGRTFTTADAGASWTLR